MKTLLDHLVSREHALAVATALLAIGLARTQGATVDQANAMVFGAFPEADSYRRIARDVDDKARKAVEQRLPFKVHFNELGEHTLFVAFRSRRPVGFVYVRTEETEWGLAEVAWALTLDLRVQGFHFLRGRNPQQQPLETSLFAKQIAGRDFEAIIAMLADASCYLPWLPEDAEGLAKMVLRSAAKALVVTNTVWQDQVSKLQDAALGYDAFPSASRFPCSSGEFDLVVADKPQVVGVKIVRAMTNNGQLLGSVLRTESQLDGETMTLLWILDGEMRIRRVTPTRLREHDELRLACLQLEGKPLNALPTEDDLLLLLPLARGLAALITIKARGE